MLRKEEWASAYGSIGSITQSQLTNIPIDILEPWTSSDGKAQPFRAYSEAKLSELSENIKRNGVIEPICVRPLPSGSYQIIAGHNRVKASQMAGLTTIPALVQQMSDEEAALRMVDSNLQHREQLLPSEKAYAYLERMKALKALQGQDAPRGKSRDLLATEAKESATQIQRYIRLTNLEQYLLDQVDNGKLALRAGVSLSYLSADNQSLLIALIEDKRCKLPSAAQAEKLHDMENANLEEFDEESVLSVLCPPKKKKTPPKFSMDRITSLFPENASGEQIEAEIYAALIAYRNSSAN